MCTNVVTERMGAGRRRRPERRGRVDGVDPTQGGGRPDLWRGLAVRILVRVVEGSSDVATAARLLTHAAGYASQWHTMGIRRNRVIVRVVEGSSDVAAAETLLTHVVGYASQ